MGSSDGNQDPSETPDLTYNVEAVEINADAQKVKKYANIICYTIQLCSYCAMLTNSKEKNKQVGTLLVQTTDTSTGIWFRYII